MAVFIISFCKNNANREQNHQACLNVMPRCRLFSAKVMQNFLTLQHFMFYFEYYIEFVIIRVQKSSTVIGAALLS